jgi:hypothetical protein
MAFQYSHRHKEGEKTRKASGKWNGEIQPERKNSELINFFQSNISRIKKWYHRS